MTEPLISPSTARLMADTTALRIVLAQLIGRLAHETDDAEEYVLSLTGSLRAAVPDDRASAIVYEAFQQLADAIDAQALEP